MHMKGTPSDNMTNFRVTGIYTHCNTNGISVTNCHNPDDIEIFNQSKEITLSFKSIHSIIHQTQQNIKTIGQPVNSHS